MIWIKASKKDLKRLQTTPTGGTEFITEHTSGKPTIRHHHGFVPVDIIEVTLEA